MRKNEFIILNSLYNGNIGRAECTYDIERILAQKDVEALNVLIRKGYVTNNANNNTITELGIRALEPYRVNNAIILAAGASTRFIPLSLEQPKGLYEVKGEKLIERQIMQLQAAGIHDITVVLGYKKDMFYYLKEKYGVKFIINEAFNVKNNIESIYLAKNELKNTYICVSDSYFMENPFNQFEYHSFNTGVFTNEKCEEMYVDIDSNNLITKMSTDRHTGDILLGFSFWKKEFSDAFIELVDDNRLEGKYNQCFWEWLVKDFLDKLPHFYFKKYLDGNIFEFDFFEDLRKFDTHYLSYTHSEIMRNIKLVFRCDEEEIVNFRNISKGLTNTSFIFRVGEVDYIYRHPGEGTERIISRKNEKTSLLLAKKIGVDPTYIYEDVNEGWKISEFIPEFREPDYNSFEDTKKIMSVLRKLHGTKIFVDYGMKPWEDAVKMELMLKKKNHSCFDEYEQLKEKIAILYDLTKNDGVEKCFCHGDTYKSNWMIRPDDSVILIDWEYSGFSDPGIDVGYYIVDAMYDFNMAERVIKEYLQDTYDEKVFFHYMAYVAIIAYYWFVWALYREACGTVMEKSLENWRDMALKYADYLLK